MSKRFNRLRYILIPNALYYITGEFIYDYILDYIHFKQNKQPKWPDAKTCDRKYCRYCGGKAYANLKK